MSLKAAKFRWTQAQCPAEGDSECWEPGRWQGWRINLQ